MKKAIVIFILLASIVTACAVPAFSLYSTTTELNSGVISADTPDNEYSSVKGVLDYLLDIALGKNDYEIQGYLNGSQCIDSNLILAELGDPSDILEKRKVNKELARLNEYIAANFNGGSREFAWRIIRLPMIEGNVYMIYWYAGGITDKALSQVSPVYMLEYHSSVSSKNWSYGSLFVLTDNSWGQQYTYNYLYDSSWQKTGDLIETPNGLEKA